MDRKSFLIGVLLTLCMMLLLGATDPPDDGGGSVVVVGKDGGSIVSANEGGFQLVVKSDFGTGADGYLFNADTGALWLVRKNEKQPVVGVEKFTFR